MILKAMLAAAAVALATTAYAQPQPQTPADPQPKTQGEVPSNALPAQKRDTSLPTMRGDTGSHGGEGKAAGDRRQTTGTQK